MPSKKLDQRKSTLLKADFLLMYTLLRATSGDPSVMVRRTMRTSNSHSGAVIGLEIWCQVSIHIAGPKPGRSLCSSRSRSCHLQRVEYGEVKGCHSAVLSLAGAHIKCESISSEKISDTVKITMALQHVRGNLALSLNVSVSESTTWIQVRNLLINYFNNAAPVENRSIYQFNNPDKNDEINYVKKGEGKGQKSKGPQKGKDQKGPQAILSLRALSQKERERSMDHLVMESESELESESRRPKRSKRKRKGHLSGLWQIWSSSSSMLVEQSAIISATISELKACLQHLRASSGSTNQDSETRSASRLSRSMTCSSASSATQSESSIHSLWVSLFCSVSLWPSKQIEWSPTQHQSCHSTR